LDIFGTNFKPNIFTFLDIFVYILRRNTCVSKCRIEGGDVHQTSSYCYFLSMEVSIINNNNKYAWVLLFLGN